MKLSTKARYALLGMMELAVNDKQRSVPLVELSRLLGISLSYVEQLFAVLRSEGYVKGTRGPGGGYRLTDKAWKASMADIFCLFENHADEGDREGTAATGEETAHHPAFAMWDTLSRQIHDYLDGITFSRFVEEQLGELKKSAA